MRACMALVLVAACYAPALPTGASCADGEPCPDGLVCAGATKTCELEPGAAVDAAVVGEDGAPDAAGPFAITLIGLADASANGNDVKFSVEKAVPVGAVLVVAIAARGNTPTMVTDKKSNTWTRAVEVENSTETTVAAIFHATVTSALDEGDEITATVTLASGFLRKVAVFRLEGVTLLDQAGAARTTGSSAVVTTAGPVAAPAQLMVGVVATGFNAPDTYVPGNGFTEVHEFGSQFSSGSFDTKLTTVASGPQTMSIGTAQDDANYAVVLATYR